MSAGGRPDTVTDWRAVLYGAVVTALAEAVGLALPGVGHLAAGLVGGFVAGYVAGGGAVRGGWHGLLAGSIVGLLLGLLVGVVVGAAGSLLGPVGGLLGGGLFLAIAAFTLLGAIPSALAGAIGALLS